MKSIDNIILEGRKAIKWQKELLIQLEIENAYDEKIIENVLNKSDYQMKYTENSLKDIVWYVGFEMDEDNIDIDIIILGQYDKNIERMKYKMINEDDLNINIKNILYELCYNEFDINNEVKVNHAEYRFYMDYYYNTELGWRKKRGE